MVSGLEHSAFNRGESWLRLVGGVVSAMVIGSLLKLGSLCAVYQPFPHLSGFLHSRECSTSHPLLVSSDPFPQRLGPVVVLPKGHNRR